jgi:nucleoporin POM152
MLDSVNKRVIALYVFASIQMAKIASYLAKKDNMTEDILLYWCIADVAFFIGLKWAKVPWLNLNILGTVVMIVSACLINSGFASISNPSVEEISDEPVPVIEEEPIIKSSHIIGSFTVNVKAPIVAKLNPNSTVFCFRPNLSLPILIKGVPPFKVGYLIETGQDTFEYSTVIGLQDAIRIDEGSPYQPHYTKRSLESFEYPKAVLYGIQFPELASPVGALMKLINVTEQNGDLGKILSVESIQIVTCPTSSWVSAKSENESISGQGFHKCIDESFTASIKLSGIPPLTAFYMIRVGNEESIQMISSKDELEECPDHSCLLSRVNAVDRILPIKLKLESSANYVLKLLRVIDGFKNSVDYQSSIAVILPELDGKGTNIKTELTGDLIQIQGHEKPIVKFGPCDQLTIKTVFDPQNPPKAAVPLVLKGASPFSVHLEFASDLTSKVTPIALNGLESIYSAIYADEPGIFSLVSVKDRYCSGVLSQPSECKVISVIPPTLSTATTTIEEACLGAVGATIDISFTGKPPFSFEYMLQKSEIIANEPPNFVDQRSERVGGITAPRTSLRFEPNEPGMYRYLFQKVIFVT